MEATATSTTPTKNVKTILRVFSAVLLTATPTLVLLVRPRDTSTRMLVLLLTQSLKTVVSTLPRLFVQHVRQLTFLTPTSVIRPTHSTVPPTNPLTLVPLVVLTTVSKPQAE